MSCVAYQKVFRSITLFGDSTMLVVSQIVLLFKNVT